MRAEGPLCSNFRAARAPPEGDRRPLSVAAPPTHSAWPYVDAGRRCLTRLRDSGAPSFLDFTGVVAYPDDARAVVNGLTDGLPGEAIDFPDLDLARWPWLHQPRLLVPPAAHMAEYLVTHTPDADGAFVMLPVVATLILPPCLSRDPSQIERPGRGRPAGWRVAARGR